LKNTLMFLNSFPKCKESFFVEIKNLVIELKKSKDSFLLKAFFIKITFYYYCLVKKNIFCYFL